MELLVLKLGKSLANQEKVTLVRQQKGRDIREVEKKKEVKRGQYLSIVYTISFTTSRNICHAVAGFPYPHYF